VGVRRRARIAALQALFEIDCARHNPELVLNQRLQEASIRGRGALFARTLVKGVIANRLLLDGLISKYAPERPVGQLAIIDRNILRMAFFELVVDQSTPPKVVINEAVELAKKFGSDSSPRFINGVLGSFVAEKGMRGGKG